MSDELEDRFVKIGTAIYRRIAPNVGVIENGSDGVILGTLFTSGDDLRLRGVEYVTPEGEIDRWRFLFFVEIAKQAPEIVQELASLLPLWKEYISLQDEDYERKKDIAEHLMDWMMKYGLDRDWQGDFAKWMFNYVIDTFEYWENRNPECLGKNFEPIPIGTARPQEIVLAFPYVLDEPLWEVTAEEEQLWKERQKEYANAARNLELINPPEDFPVWVPFAETLEDYLTGIEELARSEIGRSSRNARLPLKTKQVMVDAYKKKIRPYCQRLKKHYEENGYKRLPQKRRAERNIRWTVLGHVLNRTYEEVLD